MIKPFDARAISNKPFRSSPSESPTGCDDLSVATDRLRHEDQEHSSPRAHCICNDPGTCILFVLVSVLILAMIQDQALVAAKRRTKHYLVETKEKSPGHKPSRGYNHSRGHGDYAGWAPWYQHISIFSTHQTGKHSHRSHQVSLVCLFLCMICLQPIQTENNTALAQGEGGCQV